MRYLKRRFVRSDSYKMGAQGLGLKTEGFDFPSDAEIVNVEWIDEDGEVAITYLMTGDPDA